MEKKELKSTLEVLLTNMNDKALLVAGKNLNTSGTSKKLNEKTKTFLIQKMLNSKNIFYTTNRIKKLGSTNIFENNSIKMYPMLRKILDNFIEDKVEENKILIDKYHKARIQQAKIKDDGTKKADGVIRDNSIEEEIIKLLENEISGKEKKVKSLNKKIQVKDEKIRSLNKKIQVKDEKIKDLSSKIKKLENTDIENKYLLEQKKINENKIELLQEKVIDFKKRIEKNNTFYNKRTKELENKLKVSQNENLNNQFISKKLSKDNSRSNKKNKNILLIQAPDNSDERRKLRISKIEIIESSLFCKKDDNFGETYDCVEDIPKRIKHDVTSYDQIYLFKDYLAIGDRDKIKKIFGKNKVKEITNIGEIKHD